MPGHPPAPPEASPETAALTPRTALIAALPPLFWAGNFIIARAARGEIPPIALALGRWAIAFLVLLPFALAPMRRDRALYRAHWRAVLALAIPGVFLFNTLVYTGLQSTSATNGMLLNSTIPVLILALGALLFRQPLGARQIAGLALSTLGVAVVVLHGDPARARALDVARGDVLIFAAMVAWALYTLMLRRLTPEIDRLGLLCVHCAIAVGLHLPLLAWEIAAGHVPTWSPAALGALLYVGLVPSVAAYLLYMRAVALIGPARTGQFIHLLPLYGALLATLFLGEPLAPYHAAGFAAILGGIVLAGRGR